MARRAPQARTPEEDPLPTERDVTRLITLGILALGVGALLAACSSTPTETEPVPSGSSSVAKVFEGTPAEYTVLNRACLEEAGFETGDDPLGGVGFTISTGSRSMDDVGEVSEQCWEELGYPKMSGLSEAELRTRYEARTDQWVCLVDNDLISGDPPTFEVFVDEYKRSGETLLWEPTEKATVVQGTGGPSSTCPRSGAVW